MVYRARRCVRNMWGGAPKRSRSSPQVNRFSFEKKCISGIDGAGGGGYGTAQFRRIAGA